MYHLELRQFPHNLCRFNLTEQELRAIVEPWTRDPWVELGERKWRPETAKLTVLEGPQIPLSQLSMGRGWRIVQRNGKDVTERVLAAAKQEPADVAGSPELPQQAPPDAALVADSLGLELLALLGDGPAPLSQAWRLAAARFPERSPSECLAIAEAAAESLLRSGLIALLQPSPEDQPRQADRHRGRRTGEPRQTSTGCSETATAGPSTAALSGCSCAGSEPARVTLNSRFFPVVGVAQLVELLVVVQAVGGSSPLAHPS